MFNPTAEKFLEVFASADSIEIDGVFCRNYDNRIQDGSEDPSDEVINLTMEVDGVENEVIITADDLDEITLCDEGRTWHVGEHEIEFFSVKSIDTNPA